MDAGIHRVDLRLSFFRPFEGKLLPASVPMCTSFEGECLGDRCWSLLQFFGGGVTGIR